MAHRKTNRRDFNKLATAALSGLITGHLGGCGKSDQESATSQATQSATEAIEQPGVEYDQTLLMQEPHVCRGLNTCKGNGSCKTLANDCKGKNACAGQGACATAEKHVCSGFNDCKGQGGCGERPGENSCKEKGACAVPLTKETWPKARKRFEEIMDRSGKKYGSAPVVPKAPGA